MQELLPEKEFAVTESYDEWVNLLRSYDFVIHSVPDTLAYKVIFPEAVKKYKRFMMNVVCVLNHTPIVSETREFKTIEDVTAFLELHNSDTFVPYQVLRNGDFKYYIRGAMLNG